MHMEDIDQIFAPRGAMELVERAKRDGKVRHVGFTGHMDPRVLAKMLAAYDWDTVLMPLSVTDGANKHLSFERTTLPKAVEKGLGVMAMKTTGVGVLHEQGISSLEGKPQLRLVPADRDRDLGCSSPDQVDRDLMAARAHSRLNEAQMSALRGKWAGSDFAAPRILEGRPRGNLASSGPDYYGD